MALTDEQLADLPVGTSNPQALARNASDIDKIVNGAEPVVNRLGVGLLSVSQAMALLGLEAPVAFAAGLAITRSTQTVANGGNTYHANPAALPFTTTSTFVGSNWILISNVTRQDLADDTSAAAGAGLMKVNLSLNYLAGTVGALLKTLSAWKDALADSVLTFKNKTIKASDGNVVEVVAGPDSTALSHRNRITNPKFNINQRGYVSGTATTGANQYTLDMWRIVVSGQSVSWVASGSGSRITAPAGGIEQVIEGANIEGGTYTVSWTGTAACMINGTVVANGGQVTLTAGSNATIRLLGGTAELLQLEPGGAVTPFVHRSIAVELADCQRYFETGKVQIDGYGAASSSFSISTPFKVTKRAAPTMTRVFGYGNCSGGNTDNVTVNEFRSVVAVSGTGATVFTNTWTASAEPGP